MTGWQTIIINGIVVSAIDPLIVQTEQTVGKLVLVMVRKIIHRKLQRNKVLLVIEGHYLFSFTGRLERPGTSVYLHTGDQWVGTERIFLQLRRVKSCNTTHATK